MFFEKEIKEALLKAGLAENLADRIKVDKVDDIEGAVTALKEDMDKVINLTNEEFLEAIKKAGLDDAYQKSLKSETDRRVTQALETNKEKLAREASELVEKKRIADEKAKELSSMTEDQKEIASLKETLKGINTTLKSLKDSINTNSLESIKLSELEKVGLKENNVSRIKGDTPEQIADEVSKLKADMDTYKQDGINKQLQAGDLALGKVGTSGKTAGESAVTDYAKSKNSAANTDGLAAKQTLAIEKK